MDSARLTDIVITTALATLFAVAGALSAAVGLQARAGRIPAFLLTWALLQHGVNVAAGSPAIQTTFGGSPRMWAWLATATGYFVAVPWALLVEQVVGRGWKSSIRRTWQGYLAFAAGALVYDIATRQPGASNEVSRIVVAAGATVGFLNLWPGVNPTAPHLAVLRVAYLVFMALVVHDALSHAGLLPWRTGSGPLGVLVFVAGLAYTVVSRTQRRERDLVALESELETARRIQASLLPPSAPSLSGATLAFRYVPAAAVAGDFLEFLAADSRRAGMLLADVSGHGVPAALIASMVKVAAAAQAPHADDPSRVLAGVHTVIASQLPLGQFVTAVYAYIDLDRGVLRHASAGHPPALVWRAAERTTMTAGPTGPLLISFAPAQYPMSEIGIQPGDRIVLYTDGVVEAMRQDGEMFGVERLSRVIAQPHHGPDGLLSSAMSAVTRFAGRGGPLDDDCTMIALEIEPHHL